MFLPVTQRVVSGFDFGRQSLAPDGHVRDGDELEGQGSCQEDQAERDLVESAEFSATCGEDEHHEGSGHADERE